MTIMYIINRMLFLFVYLIPPPKTEYHCIAQAGLQLGVLP